MSDNIAALFDEWRYCESCDMRVRVRGHDNAHVAGTKSEIDDLIAESDSRRDSLPYGDHIEGLLLRLTDTITSLQADLARAEGRVQQLEIVNRTLQSRADDAARAEATIEAVKGELDKWNHRELTDIGFYGEAKCILAAYPTSTTLNEIRAQAIEGYADAVEANPHAEPWQKVNFVDDARDWAAEIRNTKEAGE